MTLGAFEGGTNPDLARWIVRLNAKGEASNRGGDLRRLALVTCARGVAEVQLYKQQQQRQQQQQKAVTRVRSRSGSPAALQSRKRLHSSHQSHLEAASTGPFSASCHCDSCNLCSNYQAAGANSCYCKALGYVTFNRHQTSLPSSTESLDCSSSSSSSPSSSNSSSSSLNGSLLSDDEESKLIDDFLTSLDGVPSSKKCKRL